MITDHSFFADVLAKWTLFCPSWNQARAPLFAAISSVLITGSLAVRDAAFPGASDALPIVRARRVSIA